jgi:hypothetical protein
MKKNKTVNTLTPKEGLFLKLYTDPKSKTFGNQTQSAMEVWKNQSYETAKQYASRVVTKCNYKLTDLMDNQGLSDGKLLKKFSEWIDAKKTMTSMTEPDKIVEDYQTQLKAGEMIIKLKGLGQNQINNQTNIQINAGDFFKEAQ